MSMSTAEAIRNRLGAQIELIITSLPLVILVFCHQTLNTVDEREMIALHNESDGSKKSITCSARQTDLIIKLTSFDQASIAQASTVSKKHSVSPCCNNK